MRLRDWYWPALAVIVAFNVGYTGWAMSLPVHEATPYTMLLPISPDVASAATPEGVAEQLRARGWEVESNTPRVGSAVVATRPDDPGFEVWFNGLGGREYAVAAASFTCNIGYLQSDCPGPADVVLRARLSDAIEASGLPLDAREARLDDNDFETWGEFMLGVLQLFLGAISLAVAFVLLAAAELPRFPDGGRGLR